MKAKPGDTPLAAGQFRVRITTPPPLMKIESAGIAFTVDDVSRAGVAAGSRRWPVSAARAASAAAAPLPPRTAARRAPSAAAGSLTGAPRRHARPEAAAHVGQPVRVASEAWSTPLRRSDGCRVIRSSASHAADLHSTPLPTPHSTSIKAAVRTPLIRLDLPFASDRRPDTRGLSQARVAAADRLVQDSRRVERGAQAVAGADERRRVDGQRRQRGAGRRVRRAARRRAVLGDGDGHRAADQAARDRKARRDDRQGDLRRVLEDRRIARLAAHARPLRPSVRRRRLHCRQRHRGSRDPRGPARRRCGGRRPGRRRAAVGHRLGDARDASRACASMPPNPKPPRRSSCR